MLHRPRFTEQATMIRQLLRWSLIVIPIAAVTGSLVALFLWLLDLATLTRWQHGWLLFLLPAAGVIIHFAYRTAGKNAEAGNNLIMDEIHSPGGGVPARMTPLVLVSTLVTHLFGGSAGREGTAVQMGGSMSALYARILKLSGEDLRILLMAGIAAGFGAVFGTPVAGAVFALEVLTIGVIRYQALLPCFIASVVADIVCAAWGIRHTHYPVVPGQTSHFLFPFIHIDLMLLIKSVIAGICFGLAGYFFSWMLHAIKNTGNKLVAVKWAIPVIGGGIVIILCYLAGTRDYIGLGVLPESGGGISLVTAFLPGGVDSWSWLWKLVFTAVTLGTGFKGGEVTPLFFIGAALGNTLAATTGAPVDLFAAMGFIAVFAGATNTPLACTIMGIELFGGEYILYYAIACFTAYYFSGRSGIYSSRKQTGLKLQTKGIKAFRRKNKSP